MPDVQVTAVGARGDHPDLTHDELQRRKRDHAQRSTVSDERESEDKDDAAPGSLEWKEQG
jgi:hypothetical protein